MPLNKRVARFFIEILNLYTLFIWLLCMGLNMLVFAGVAVFSAYIQWRFIYPSFSTLYKDNPYYGSVSVRSYTPRVYKDLYDSNGSKIGYYETDGKKIYRSVKDTQMYLTRPIWFYFYMLAFPTLRVITILLSLIAIFSKKFYISPNVPDLYALTYKNDKRRKRLYTWFNIILVDKK